MQIRRPYRDAQFLPGFAAGAGIRRLAQVHFQLAAARAPETAVGFLRAFKQQHVVTLIEAVKQGGDLVRQNHGASFEFRPANVERVKFRCHRGPKP